jgi:phosphoglycolate phosphatase
MKHYKAWLFDMDGTVLNTLDDLSAAMKYALQASGHSTDFGNEATGAFFGSGVTVAITRALAYEKGRTLEELVQVGTAEDAISPTIDQNEVSRIETVYRPYYDAHCLDQTAPYPGIPEAIRTLRGEGILTAVVSNKLDGAVQELVRDLFPGMFDFCLGESETIRRKPAPDMTLRCMEVLGADPETAVYVGDSEVDLQTAANTGMPCIAVDWGFRTRQFLESRGANVIVSDAEGLLSAILDPGKDL